jgi:hypothetical protein
MSIREYWHITISEVIAFINFSLSSDGGIGRRAGLKIQWPVMAVWVRFPLRVQ